MKKYDQPCRLLLHFLEKRSSFVRMVFTNFFTFQLTLKKLHSNPLNKHNTKTNAVKFLPSNPTILKEI